MYIDLAYSYDSNNRCWISFSGTSFSVTAGKENWPVVNVTWYGSKTFAVKYGFDLPREAEWEYASRGGKGYEYGTDDGTISCTNANYWDCSTLRHPVDVGSYPSNPFGLYDLAGNVWEWCNDWYGSYGSGNENDPQGPPSGSSRVLRGGGWYSSADGCRSAFRHSSYPYGRNVVIGFRVVRR
jgi:formylglycine-generating enzyme required for sulfatase activity